MQLAPLIALGCHYNGQFLDHYDGHQHTRIGEGTSDGELVAHGAGLAYAEALMLDSYVEVLTSPSEPLEAAPKKAKKVAIKIENPV